MATVRPFRTSYDTMVDHWAFWDAVAGAFVEHDGDYVLVAADNTPVERYRAAIKFFNPTAPTWTGTGPIAAAGTALLIMMDQRIEIGGGLIIQIANITDPWDGTETAAEMRALGIDIWRNLTAIQKGYGIPEALFTSASLNSDNGIMLRSITARCIRFSMRTEPLLRFLWQYTPTLTTRGDSTARNTLSTAALAVMEDNAEGIYRQDIDALISERDPSSSDVALTSIIGADPGSDVRELTWPESWNAVFPPGGGIPISDVSDAANVINIRGATIRTLLNIIYPDGAEEEISRSVQIAGDVTRRENGEDELELRNPGTSILEKQVVNYDPSGTQTVEYDNENPIYIMIDSLLNTNEWLYERMYYNDLVFMLRRFGGVWSTLTFLTSDLSETTVQDMIDIVGPLYGLAIAQAAEGSIILWQPAVYRPSIKTWELDEGDCISLEIIDRGRDGQYAGVRVTDLADPAESRTVYPTEHFPGVVNDWDENLYDVTAKGNVFEDWRIAKDGLGRQLAQRLCGRRVEMRAAVGPRGLAYDLGDQIKMTAHSLDAVTTFLITGIQRQDGLVSIDGIHYPDSLGLHSTFEDTSELQGIWRWYDPVIGDNDLTNQAYTGGDPAWTVFNGAFLNPFAAHWQGTLYGSVVLNNVQLIDTTAGVADTFDLCLGMQGDIDDAIGGIGALNWNDPEYVPIMMWRKAAGREGIAIGIYRPGFPGTNSALDNQLFVGHSLDIEANPIVWATVALSEHGVVGHEDDGSADLSMVPVSLAIEWKDSAIQLRTERSLLLSTGGMSKTGYTKMYIRAHGALHGYAEINFGCLRHIKTRGFITELQRLQGLNGIDPYYP